MPVFYMTGDFFSEEADERRGESWNIIFYPIHIIKKCSALIFQFKGLCFSEKGRRFSGVEIKGDMTVLAAQPTKQRFWKPFFTRFYKKVLPTPIIAF